MDHLSGLVFRRPQAASHRRAVVYFCSAVLIVYLNETASLIWHLCDGQRTTDEVAELLRDSFPEPGGTIADDIEATLRLFVDHGAIEFV